MSKWTSQGLDSDDNGDDIDNNYHKNNFKNHAFHQLKLLAT